jgi:hypothetical protein
VLATADGVGIVEIMRTAAGVSKTAVWRWQARFMDEGVDGLLPKFAAKVRDIVGLYVDPPAHSVVLSVDEKSQIQALDRTQPGLPMKKGRAGTMTHDYKRHGTTTLFAAFDILEGNVIGRCMQRHRHQEFIRFLNAVEGFFAMLTQASSQARRFQGRRRSTGRHQPLRRRPQPAVKALRLDRRSRQNHRRRRTRAPGAGVNPLTLAMVVRRSAPNVHSPESGQQGSSTPNRHPRRQSFRWTRAAARCIALSVVHP